VGHVFFHDTKPQITHSLRFVYILTYPIFIIMISNIEQLRCYKHVICIGANTVLLYNIAMVAAILFCGHVCLCIFPIIT
jgi:hypothetical protein